ncbi:MAG: very short patch repair endonuclease [Phycisphaerae bacterium]
MADVYSKKKRREIMSRVRSKGTKPEEAVAEILDSMGVDYTRNVNDLPGCPDFVVGEKQTVLFVHGCFWHGHRNCSRAKKPGTNARFWDEKISGNQRRDRRNARRLRKQGWTVLTVWQCKLRSIKERQKTVRRIKRYL